MSTRLRSKKVRSGASLISELVPGGWRKAACAVIKTTWSCDNPWRAEPGAVRCRAARRLAVPIIRSHQVADCRVRGLRATVVGRQGLSPGAPATHQIPGERSSMLT